MYEFTDFIKFLFALGILGMKVQELGIVSFLPGNLPADGKVQVKIKTQGPDVKVHKSRFALRLDKAPCPRLRYDGVGDGLLFKVRPVDVPNVDVLFPVHDIDAKDIKLVGVPDEAGKMKFPFG